MSNDSKTCRFPPGISIRPDGIHELDPHLYETVEIHHNVTVEVRRCVNCGQIDLVWFRQEDTASEQIHDDPVE